jgi:hypothetical protein
MLILPASRQVQVVKNSRHWTRQQLQCFLIIPGFPARLSKFSSFPDDQLSDHPSESSSSAFSATSASDFNHCALLSAVEQLHPALDELRAWQQAWQPVIDRVQAQQRDSDLVQRDILSQLRRLQSSRATQEQDLIVTLFLPSHPSLGHLR